MKLFNILLIAATLSAVICQYEHCSGEVNEQPLVDVEPKLLSTTENGQKYLLKQGSNYVYIVNVQGTPYEMGYAHGKLLKEEIKENFALMTNYIQDGFQDYLEQLEFIPNFLCKKLAEYGLTLFQYLLKLNYDVALDYIPARYVEEVQGMSDATGLTYEYIMDFNMIPELIKAACTIAGTWQESTEDGKLLTLRALDWSSDAPINKNPAIVVYHSNEEGSYPFANVGYAGLIGSLTAVGSQGVSVQEKVWIPREQEIPTTYFGKPWAFVLRDLAQFETTLEGMATTLQETSRTCKIHIGFASAEDNAFEGVDYSWQVLEFFNDKNYTDYAPWHPQLDGVMYFDKHPQPSTDYCVGDILSDNWGHINRETLFRQIGGLSKTGDTQICVADVHENTIWLSYSEYGTNIKAYQRSPMYIDLKPFYFGQQQQQQELEY